MSKVIVITGASTGIGAETARLLGARGDSLVLAARREKELKQVTRESSTSAIAVVANVTHRKEVEHLRDRALEEFGRVDVWINNAGQGISRPVRDLTDEDIDLMIAVNVKSALYGMQAILPHFEERGEGHIINISSFLAKVPLASPRSVYSAAKAALNSLTANLRMDLAKTHPGIDVSIVMPGMVDTDFHKSALRMESANPPLPYSGQKPEEVAEVIVKVIDEPVAEVFTNPSSPGMYRKYFEDPTVFDKG